MNNNKVKLIFKNLFNKLNDKENENLIIENSNNEISIIEIFQKLFRPFYKEWFIWLPFAVLSFCLASAMVGGWRHFFIPDFDINLLDSGDLVTANFLIKYLIEHNTWYPEFIRTSFPFKSYLYDYPSFSSSIYFLAILLKLFFKNSINIFILISYIGYPLIFLSSYLCSRAFNLDKINSICLSILYTFIPFHYFRMFGHNILGLYFQVPFYIFLSYTIFNHNIVFKKFFQKNYLYIFILIFIYLISAHVVYYTAFGIITLAIGLIGNYFNNFRKQNLIFGITLIILVFLFFLSTLIPNFYFWHLYGNSLNVASRHPLEAELYGLKIIQLLLPAAFHRLNSFASLSNYYNSTFPLVNENNSSSLGLIGVIGFIILVFCLLDKKNKFIKDNKIYFFSILNFLLIFISTIGGLIIIFNIFVSAQLRCWNRISVFLSYLTLSSLFLTYYNLSKYYINKYKNIKYLKIISIIFIIFITFLGFLDITPKFGKRNSNDVNYTGKFLDKNEINFIKNFIEDIEKISPENSAIYQLPFLAFPEVPPIYKMAGYNHFIGYIYSKNLNWSYGAMKGREGDVFYKNLSQRKILEQLYIIQKMGFGGIYIDRYGYNDNAIKLETEISKILNKKPDLISEDKNKRFSFYLLDKNKILPQIKELNKIKIVKLFDEENNQKEKWIWSNKNNLDIKFYNLTKNEYITHFKFEVESIFNAKIKIKLKQNNSENINNNSCEKEIQINANERKFIEMDCLTPTGIYSLNFNSNAKYLRAQESDPREISFKVLNLEILN